MSSACTWAFALLETATLGLSIGLGFGLALVGWLVYVERKEGRR